LRHRAYLNCVTGHSLDQQYFNTNKLNNYLPPEWMQITAISMSAQQLLASLNVAW